jgi:hypothetical protein
VLGDFKRAYALGHFPGKFLDALESFLDRDEQKANKVIKWK